MLYELLKVIGVYGLYERWLQEQIDSKPKPSHIGVITDGNRRWAAQRDMIPWEGHWEGAERVEDFLEWCMGLDIKTVTLYSFSTENFRRDEKEVEELMMLFEKTLEDVMKSDYIHKNRVRIRALGRRGMLPERVQTLIHEVEESTQDYDSYYLNIAIAYGGRAEIVDFISELAARERGDARYAIDVLHGSGKIAEAGQAAQIMPEHVREAAMGVFQTLNKETVRQLGLHEQLMLLGVARFFQAHSVTHGTTREMEEAYRLACEEYGEAPRGHTMYWKYLRNRGGLDFVNVKPHASSMGRTQLISLERVPAGSLEREVKQIIEQGRA